MKSKHNPNDDEVKLRRHALVGPAHLWQSKRQAQFEFLKSVGLEPRHYLLDLGCGTLRGGIPLIEYLNAGHYFGFDVRENVIQEAHKELAEYGLEQKSPTLFFAGSIREFSPDKRFHYVWAYSVLIHMFDEVLRDTMESVSSLLAPDGCFFANVRLGDADRLAELEQLDHRMNGSGSCREFPLVTRPIDFYRETAAEHGLSLVDMGTTDKLGFDPSVAAHKLHHMLAFEKV